MTHKGSCVRRRYLDPITKRHSATIRTVRGVKLAALFISSVKSSSTFGNRLRGVQPSLAVREKAVPMFLVLSVKPRARYPNPPYSFHCKEKIGLGGRGWQKRDCAG